MKVTNVEELMERIEQIKEAQRRFATYSQEQVDEIFRQAAMAANNSRIKLA
jgi:acetaldehyde dehydrogenase/alcohol dehydrogenase